MLYISYVQDFQTIMYKVVKLEDLLSAVSFQDLQMDVCLLNCHLSRLTNSKFNICKSCENNPVNLRRTLSTVTTLNLEFIKLSAKSKLKDIL